MAPPDPPGSVLTSSFCKLRTTTWGITKKLKAYKDQQILNLTEMENILFRIKTSVTMNLLSNKEKSTKGCDNIGHLPHTMVESFKEGYILRDL